MNLTKSWVRTGSVCGLLAVAMYLTLKIPLDVLEHFDHFLFFGFGVVGVVFAVGLYHLLSTPRDRVLLQVGALFCIIAGALVTTMATVQVTTRLFIRQYIREAPDEATKETLRLVWKGVNPVQLGIDISYDIFLLVGLFLLATAMLRHPRFGKVFGGVGIVLSALTLGLNLYTFPEPPGEALGRLFDLGPLVGVWLIAVAIQMLRSIAWIDTISEPKGTDLSKKSDSL